MCYNKNMKTYVVGNWKLNFTVGESSIYLHKLMKALPVHRGMVVAPSTIALQPLSLQIDRHKIKLAAQNGFIVTTARLRARRLLANYAE